MKLMVLFTVWIALSSPVWAADETRTNPKGDIFVEKTETDFSLSVAKKANVKKKLVAFTLSVPEAGSYEVVCFIGGKLHLVRKMKLPGELKLSTRGLAPARYRITLQTISASGKIGSHTLHLVVK
jgi:hypothetical protein